MTPGQKKIDTSLIVERTGAPFPGKLKGIVLSYFAVVLACHGCA